MKYLFVGDTHGAKDLDRLINALPKAGLHKSDAILHCGDFGAPWIADDDETLRWWQALPHKKIVCLGNHENYRWISSRPLVRRFGAQGYDLGGGLFAPLPGEIAVIGRRTFWFYPGGLSIDFFLRTPGRTVFAQELLTHEASQKALATLRKRGPVDYIVSHDGPRRFVQAHFGFPISPPPAIYYRHLNLEADSRAHPGLALDNVAPFDYGRWYFGHHHRDVAAHNIRCLWQQLVLEDSLSGAISEL